MSDKTVILSLAERLEDIAQDLTFMKDRNTIREAIARLAQEAGPVVERQDSKNQCDGCMAGKPLENGNRHRMGSGAYPDFMSCTAKLYTSPPAPVAPEEPIAYMRNEGEPNNLVKCTFACPGAFGVYAKRAL